MSSATVTTKGQVTIPIDVRTKLGLRPGSRVAFVPTDSGGYEIHVEAASVRDLKGSVPRPPRPITVEEMNEAASAGATATSS